jgi:DNA helicase-2/ATP-dependent DNA helicase PcrA
MADSPKTVTFDKAYKNLNKAQKQAVDAIEGPVMVVAGPGTGKTTLLTLRIANILRQTDVGPENILALTFTNSGVTAMRKKLLEYIGDDAYRVGIFTFHSFAENIIKEFSFYFSQLENATVISDLEKVQILEEIISAGDSSGKKFKEIISKHDEFSSLSQIMSAINDIKKEGLNPEEFADRIPGWEKELMADENLFYKRNFGKYKKGDIKPSEKEKIEKKIAKAKEVAEVFSIYQEKLSEKNFYDFDDMILSVLGEISENENLKLDLQEKYQYLLVDEHQDTNDGQNRLIELLTDAEHLNGHPNLFTVGDEKQSIYRFQGASEETFKHFNEIYRDVEIVNLTENYRSIAGILSSSHDLITKTLPDAQKLNAALDLNGSKESAIEISEKPQVMNFSNYKFELLYVVNEIKEKISNGTNPAEIAVIYRSNKNVEEIRDLLNQKQIPHTILSKENILSDKNINNLISILRTVDNPNNNHYLAKSLLIDFLNLDSYEVVNALHEFNIKSRNRKVRSLFDFIYKTKNKDNVIEGADEFVKKIKNLKTDSENSHFASFFKKFIEEIGYLDYMLKANDSRDQLVKIDKLFDEIKRQSQSQKDYSLADFLKFIDSYQKYNLTIESNNPEVTEGVKLMTAHKSKGLEFEHVYIINSVRSSWEKSRGFPKIPLPIDDYKGDVDDERRLFYVAMTRAKKTLTITSALTDWEGKEKERTQFISEIEPDLLDEIETNEFEKKNIDKLSAFIKSADNSSSLWDKKYIKDLFLKNNLSVTALNNYLDCPIKYLFRSLLKLPSDFSPNLLYGDLIHSALDKFFNESKKSEKIETKNKLIDFYNKAIDQSSFSGSDYEKYLERGRQTLAEYYDNYVSDWTFKIETEKRIKRQFQLDSGEEINLSGILDKVEFLESEIEGKINIIDYKTGKPYSDKSVKTQKEDLDRQLVFYHLLLEGYNDNKFTINNSVLDFVEKNKKGNYEQHIVDVSEEDLSNLKEKINEVSKEIISGEFLDKGCDKRDCEFCRLI